MDAQRNMSGNAAYSQTARGCKLNTTPISVTEFVSLTNFTLHTKLCQKKSQELGRSIAALFLSQGLTIPPQFFEANLLQEISPSI